MDPKGAAPILLCAGDLAAVDDLRRLLEQAGHTIGWHDLAGTDPEELPAYSLIVLEGSHGPARALHFCRRLRAGLAETFTPILFVTSDHTPAARLASFEGGADTYLLRPFAPGELLAQVQAFLRIKEVHDRLTEKTAEVHRINKRLQAAHQRIDQELELARRIQQSFLPQTLPQVPQVRFAVSYHPCGRVGGDFYDVFRLDEAHVGLYVADAMGHGVPASLLTIFLKKGVRTKEISGHSYRLVPPGEVLERLNHDLIEQGLAENPFITMVYGLFNFQTGLLQLARAGHPHPLHLPLTGEPQWWKVEGTLMGVFETRFRTSTHQVRPGDKVLFYTDGIDSLALEGQQPGNDSLLAGAVRYRTLLIDAFVENLTGDLLRQANHPDDFTLVGLEMTRA